MAACTTGLSEGTCCRGMSGIIEQFEPSTAAITICRRWVIRAFNHYRQPQEAETWSVLVTGTGNEASVRMHAVRQHMPSQYSCVS